MLLKDKKFVFVMCGLPGSGKSTVARKLADEGAIVLSEDALVTMYHGGDYTRYQEDLSPFYKDAFSMLVSSALANAPGAVVIDRCCPKAETRRRWASAADAWGYTPVLLYFPLRNTRNHRELLTLRRFQEDARGHSYSKWQSVIDGMAHTFQPPHFMAEGFSYEVCINNAHGFDAYDAMAMVEDWLRPVGDQSSGD